MTQNSGADPAARVLLLAPTSRDAELSHAVLARGGMVCEARGTLEAVCAELDNGGGAVVVPEEAIAGARKQRLVSWLLRQPAWSDLPIVVLTRPGADSAAVSQAMELLGNVTVLERPVRIAALVSALRSALRARQRQYQLRDHLAERERHYQTTALMAAIVTSSDDAILSHTLDGTILTWNQGAQRLFGYAAAEMLGQPLARLIPPERTGEDQALAARLRNGEHVEHFETVRVAKDGRRIDISLTVSPLRDPAGRIIAASIVARDITERKKAEAALLEASRRKDVFLATLAHELRNPLAPLSNSLQLLQLSTRDPALLSVVAMMERQTRHLVRLVDDLLEISRITRGHIELRLEQVEIATVVANAIETSRPLIDEGQHRLHVSVPKEKLVVRGDPVRLAQVLSNLLNNAARYTDSGGVIRVTVAHDGPLVSIAVRDNGSGIPPDALARIFEPFTRLAGAAERTSSGLGVGLTLVKALVEKHGGTIEARSKGHGKGSEFTIRLKLVTERQPAPSASTPAVESPPAPRRVLIVDDNRDAAAGLGGLLRALGHSVSIIHDGATALDRLPDLRPDIALLDIGMPGMNGHELARRMRRHPDGANLVLVAVTGWGQEADRRQSEQAGFDHHLVKPVELSQIKALLNEIGAPAMTPGGNGRSPHYTASP